MIWLLYNILFPMAFVLMMPKFLLRMARRGGYRRHFEQRFGIYGKGTAEKLEECRRIWIHAVSVGEIQVALRFIEQSRKINPDARFVLSTNTSTAHALGEREINPCDVLIYFPFDMLFTVKKAFNAINPAKLILVECEIWLNLITEAKRRGIGVALINGRMSDSSYRGYMFNRPFTRYLFPMINPICVQSRQDAARMIALGAKPETVNVLGTAKYDLPPPAPDADAPARAVLKQAGVVDDAQILVGGSTWPGEEAALGEIYQKLRAETPGLFLVLVPRHAERRADVVRDIEAQGLTCSLRSQGASPADVLVIDTTGELMSFYAAADIVFVGKSLAGRGGQNPIEPARLGKPVIVGPHMENFEAVMDDFLLQNALVQVQDASGLEQAIRRLLSDPAERVRLGNAAERRVESRCGVIRRMVEQVGCTNRFD